MTLENQSAAPVAVLNQSDLKQNAKRLRQDLAERGKDISHSEALELVARQHGFRDWNTAVASLMAKPNPARRNTLDLQVGVRVSGRYLKRAFTGTVLAVAVTGSEGQDLRRIKVQFDEPVDVVDSDLFYNYRQRVQATINLSGQSSNGLGEVDEIMRITSVEPG